MIDGIGPGASFVINARGGKQSHLPYRADLLPGWGILAQAIVAGEGAEKYEPLNWHDISEAEHLNHALTHLLKLVAGDESEDHLAHAACRLSFALEIRHLREQGLWTEAEGCKCHRCVVRKQGRAPEGWVPHPDGLWGKHMGAATDYSKHAHNGPYMGCGCLACDGHRNRIERENSDGLSDEKQPEAVAGWVAAHLSRSGDSYLCLDGRRMHGHDGGLWGYRHNECLRFDEPIVGSNSSCCNRSRRLMASEPAP